MVVFFMGLIGIPQLISPLILYTPFTFTGMVYLTPYGDKGIAVHDPVVGCPEIQERKKICAFEGVDRHIIQHGHMGEFLVEFRITNFNVERVADIGKGL